MVGTGKYVVSVLNIGHLNDAGTEDLEFHESSGVVECETHRGCVAGTSAVVEVWVHNDDDSGMRLDVFPTAADNFAVNVMCEKKHELIAACGMTSDNCCQARDGGAATTTPTVQLDDAYGRGCSLVGSGVDLARVSLLVRCEPDDS